MKVERTTKEEFRLAKSGRLYRAGKVFVDGERVRLRLRDQVKIDLGQTAQIRDTSWDVSGSTCRIKGPATIVMTGEGDCWTLDAYRVL